MIYYVTIEKIISEKFKISADSIEEAMNTAEERYKEGTFVLSLGTLVTKQLRIEDESGVEATEWVHF